MNQLIRVVVVDDSALMRQVITRLLEQDPSIRVVGTAADGREAIAQVEALRPDIVTMDVRMPVMDGLATTEHLMAYCPTPILVLTASLASYDVDITFKMLGAGALEVIEKPSVSDPRSLEFAASELIRRVKVLARVKVVTHLRGRRRLGDRPVLMPAPERPERAVVSQPSSALARPSARANGVHPQAQPATVVDTTLNTFPLIVIGASTGGPRVIYQILAGLPAGLPAAVLIVQHIALGFSQGLAEWLRGACLLPVRVAAEGDALRPGEVLVAPDGHDLLINSDGRVHLTKAQLLLQRPAIDVTMQAAAEVFGARTIGVLLTGMGRDGAKGMLTIRRAGGFTIAQDEGTSAIFGMPRAAVQNGAALEVLPPAQIATMLVELVARHAAKGTATPTGGA